MTTFSEFKQMVDNYTEYAGDAKRIIDAADKYYGEQLSSLQADNERLRKALQKIDSATYAHKEWTDMHKVNHIATEALQNK